MIYFLKFYYGFVYDNTTLRQKYFFKNTSTIRIISFTNHYYISSISSVSSYFSFYFFVFFFYYYYYHYYYHQHYYHLHHLLRVDSGRFLAEQLRDTCPLWQIFARRPVRYPPRLQSQGKRVCAYPPSHCSSLQPLPSSIRGPPIIFAISESSASRGTIYTRTYEGRYAHCTKI